MRKEKKEPVAPPRSASGWEPARGPLFNVGKEPIDINCEHDETCARLEATGFVRIASRFARHGIYRDEENNPLDEFILWEHPAGLILITDSLHGRFEKNEDGTEAYNRSFKRFNSFHMYWQVRLGGGERPSVARSQGGSLSTQSEGDGCYRLIENDSRPQPGDDLRQLLTRLNDQCLAPTEEWLDAFIYLNPGLYLDNKRLGDESEAGKEEARLARGAFIDALPPRLARAFHGAKGGPDRVRPPRPNRDWNKLVTEAMTAAGVTAQEPEDSARLKALSLDEEPKSQEDWEPIGPCQTGAAHALPFFGKEARERALAAWSKLDDETALRLANTPDARGVTPFMNCFALNRSLGTETEEGAHRFAKTLMERFGDKLIAYNDEAKLSVLTLMLADAPPGREATGGILFSEEQRDRLTDQLRSISSSGIDGLRFYPLLEPESAEGDGFSPMKRPALRGEPLRGAEAAGAFSREASARLKDNAGGVVAQLEAAVLRDGLASSRVVKSTRLGL